MRAPDWFHEQQARERDEFIRSEYMREPAERARELRDFDRWQDQELAVFEGHEDPTDFSEAI